MIIVINTRKVIDGTGQAVAVNVGDITTDFDINETKRLQLDKLASVIRRDAEAHFAEVLNGGAV